MTPYYDSDGITVFCARCEDVLAAGLVPVRDVALVHGDPPYGVNERTLRGSAGRQGALSKSANPGTCKPRDWPAIHGDDQPYDPTVLRALERPTVLWGANHYSHRLPGSPSWFLWDKREGQTPDDNADGELAWSNLGGPLRIFRHFWRGALRKTEKVEPHKGPAQKPIALSSWVFQRAHLQPGALVFVPYLGSGPDLPAARAMGLRVIACDVEEWCCRTAVSRLGALPHPEPTDKLGPLFGGVS